MMYEIILEIFREGGVLCINDSSLYWTEMCNFDGHCPKYSIRSLKQRFCIKCIIGNMKHHVTVKCYVNGTLAVGQCSVHARYKPWRDTLDDVKLLLIPTCGNFTVDIRSTWQGSFT